MSIAPENPIIEKEVVEEVKDEKKQKFLEKRRTLEYHEYPAHPLPLENEEDAIEEKEGEGEDSEESEGDKEDKVENA